MKYDLCCLQMIVGKKTSKYWKSHRAIYVDLLKSYITSLQRYCSNPILSHVWNTLFSPLFSFLLIPVPPSLLQLPRTPSQLLSFLSTSTNSTVTPRSTTGNPIHRPHSQNEILFTACSCAVLFTLQEMFLSAVFDKNTSNCERVCAQSHLPEFMMPERGPWASNLVRGNKSILCLIN